jgi:hypothetical protein
VGAQEHGGVAADAQLARHERSLGAGLAGGDRRRGGAIAAEGDRRCVRGTGSGPHTVFREQEVVGLRPDLVLDDETGELGWADRWQLRCGTVERVDPFGAEEPHHGGNSTISAVDARPSRRDELHHLSSADDVPDWFETFALDFSAADASVGGYLIVTLRPGEGRSWCWACVAGADRPLVAIVEDDAPLPRRSALELRAPGLWVDVECETPFDHVSVGLEAFGLTFDHPRDAIGDRRGARTPVGFDLEWETDGDIERRRPDAYAMPCRVTGEVLVGDERFELDGAGRRAHCWGGEPWWRSPDVAGDGDATAYVAVPDPIGPPTVLSSRLARTDRGPRWAHRVQGAPPDGLG